MLSVILLFVTMALTAVGTALANDALNTNIQGFSFWYIIPIGAMLVGGLASSGIFIGQKISKSVLKSFYFVLAALAGVASFFIVSYADYKISIDKFTKEYSVYINRLSESEKKEFWDEASFLKYLETNMNESTISVSNRGREATKIEGGALSVVSFWLSIVGAGLGGIIVTSFAIGDRTKCKKCKQYKDRKFLAYADYDSFEEISEKINSTEKLGDFAIELFSKYPSTDKTYKKPPHVVLKYMLCRNCGEGELIVEQMGIQGGNPKKLAAINKDLAKEESDKVVNYLKNSQVKETH